MADVQLEDGFTRLANELLEALARVDIPGRHMRVMLYVIRNTYGRRAPGGGSRKADRLGSVDIARGSEIDAADVRRCLRDLARWNMITRHGGGGGRGDSPMVGVQKDYDRWSITTSEEAARQATYREKRGDKAGGRHPTYKAGRQSGVTSESGVTNGQKRGDVTPQSGVTSPHTKDKDSSKILPSGGARVSGRRSKGLTEPPKELTEDQRDELRRWVQRRDPDDPASRLTDRDLRRAEDACLDWFRGKGRRQKDWPATVRTWIRRDLERAGAKPAGKLERIADNVRKSKERELDRERRRKAQNTGGTVRPMPEGGGGVGRN